MSQAGAWDRHDSSIWVLTIITTLYYKRHKGSSFSLGVFIHLVSLIPDKEKDVDISKIRM